MNLQKLSFIYAYPLDAELRRSFEDRGQIYPNQDEIREVIQRWKTIWLEQNDQNKILEVSKGAIFKLSREPVMDTIKGDRGASGPCHHFHKRFM